LANLRELLNDGRLDLYDDEMLLPEEDSRPWPYVLVVPVGSYSIYWRTIPTWMDTQAYRTDSVMVPVSFAAGAVGKRVYWCEESSTATIIDLHGRVITITSGKKIMYIDDRPVLIIGDHGLPIAAQIRDRRIFIPKGMVSVALGMDLLWMEEIETAFYWFAPQADPNMGGGMDELRIPPGVPALFLDGATVPMDTSAFINDNGSKMVPISFIAGSLGLNVHWSPAYRRVTITGFDGRALVINEGEDVMALDGQIIPMLNNDGTRRAAEIKDDRMFVTLRAIEEAFGLRSYKDGIISVISLTGRVYLPQTYTVNLFCLTTVPKPDILNIVIE
jgi:hypothetical protein